VRAARQVCRSFASAVIVGLLTFSTILVIAAAVAPDAQAVDSTAMTVTAAQQDPAAADAPFPDLSVTVSQTTDLTGQGIRLTYTGGVRSTVPNQQTAGANFLQVMQCWGDLQDAVGNLVLDANGQAQPDRTTCQYGATKQPGQSRTSSKSSVADVAPQDEPYLVPAADIFHTAEVSIPFRSVTGKVLERVRDGKVIADIDLDTNEFFTRNTTNEVPWVGFGASGSGTATFEVQTNAQAPGLGCGNPVSASDGTVSGRPCWLVVIPRGDHDLGESTVTKSSLLWETWEHRLAVRLEFKPLGVRCAIGAAEKSLAGSELMTAAVGSWQPRLCGSAGGSIYNLIVANEADQALAANGTGTEALALTTRALSAQDVTDELTYAPVAISGLAIGFAIDHQSDPLRSVPSAVTALDRQPFTAMNLTPRLVAKLLTDSYTSSLPTGSDASHLGTNPSYLWQDPDFLAVNDDAWKDQNLASPSHLADLLVPLGRSDAAWGLWQYVLSDAEAVAFLAGTPDAWGMVVNPYSSTDAAANPTGTAATYPKDSLPKADPTSYTPEAMGEINLVTWRPYANDLDTAGYWVLRGDNRSLDQSSWSPLDVSPKYSLFNRDLAGSQRVIGLTDTAAAAKYQVFTAALRNSAGAFVAPTTASMAAAAAVMTPTAGQPQVRALDFTSTAVKTATGAYPLTVPVYAATNAAGGDATSRAGYAAFITYAATQGQTPGTDDGELPDGYAPLPASWVQAARAAADTIAAGPVPVATPTPTATSPSSPATSTTVSVEVSRAAGTTPVVAELPDGSPGSVSSSTSPTASGQASGPVVGRPTPDDPDVGALRAAVPIGAAGGLLAAAGVPLVARIRRRP